MICLQSRRRSEFQCLYYPIELYCKYGFYFVKKLYQYKIDFSFMAMKYMPLIFLNLISPFIYANRHASDYFSMWLFMCTHFGIPCWVVTRVHTHTLDFFVFNNFYKRGKTKKIFYESFLKEFRKIFDILFCILQL